VALVKRGILIATAAVIVLALALPATSSAGSGLRFFHTADNNIACGLVKPFKKTRKRSRLPGQARCDVKNHSWVAPPAPKFCDLDWGFGVQVGDRRGASYVCAGDTVADAKSPVLGAGGVVGVGPYSCTVLPVADTTVRCQNLRTGRGFEVSAATVSFF
jgi:hypothetical protein